MVMLEAFGVASKTYHNEAHGPDEGWESAAVVKTHLLPHQLPEELLKRKIVYLVRDGRDALVSQAHHRRDVIDPSADFDRTLEESIYAAEGSYFGGWSQHVMAWRCRADAVIHFEELIRNPAEAAKILCQCLGIAPAPTGPMPSFESLKHGNPAYGSGKDRGLQLASKWFRRGQVNAWKDEMPKYLHHVFWHLHGEVMELVGYDFSGLHHFHREKGDGVRTSSVKVLVEGNKLLDQKTDGVKRYLMEWLRAADQWPLRHLEIRVLVGNKQLTVRQALEMEQFPNPSGGLISWLKLPLKWLLPKASWEWCKQLWRGWSARISILDASTTRAEISYNIIHHCLPQNHHLVPEHNTLHVATIHDLTHETHPQFHESHNIRLAEEGMKALINRNASFIAVSASTQSDLQKRGIESRLVHEGVERSRFFPIRNQHLLDWVKKSHDLPDPPFWLSLSTLEPRKNLQNLIKAFAALSDVDRGDHHLVIAGAKGWKWERCEVPLTLRDRIHFIGYVREVHLPALYTMCDGFCCVSHYEGFGLPVLEAMACGSPCMVSNVSSLPELVGNTGVLVDPVDAQSIQLGFIRLSQLSAQENIEMETMQQTWNFSWLKMWLAYADLYESLLKGEERDDQN